MTTWRKARFKDQTVYGRVDDSGIPLVERGRIAIRYKMVPGAKTYQTFPDRLGWIDDAPVEQVDDEAAPKTPGGKAGGRARGFGKAGTRSRDQTEAAREHAATLLESLPDDTIVIYTDGACRGNPGQAGSGAVVRFPDGATIEACRALGRGTNNVAELTAVALALDVLDEADTPPDAAVALLSDSDYTNGVLTRNWKAKANRELILELRERLAARPGLVMHWVAGHAGTEGNERADQLANEGVAGTTATRRLTGS